MEENQNGSSPLASFPNEHPVTPTATTIPFYRSRMFLFGCIALVLIATGIAATTMFLGQNQNKATQRKSSPTPTSMAMKETTVQPTSAAITANWNTYTNASYGYDLKYDKEVPKEMNTPQYGYSAFENGCMKIYAVPTATVPTLPEEKNGIPWKQLDDLKTMPIGQSRNCSVLTFTFGADGKAIVDRNDYTRLTSEKINGSEWYAFSVKNALSKDVTAHNAYFIEKGTNTYVIETKTGGSCPTTPTEMLSTFIFTK